ncbi:MAG: hypothetical protein ACRC68_17730 [Clostridium sp.]
MKKSSVVIISIVIILVLGIFYYKYSSDFSYLATMSQDIVSKDSSSSEATFHSKEENSIKVKIKSKAKEGSLKFLLTNSSGEVIKTFESNKEYNEELEVKAKEEYKISAIYNDFIGEFNVKLK